MLRRGGNTAGWIEPVTFGEPIEKIPRRLRPVCAAEALPRCDSLHFVVEAMTQAPRINTTA